MKSSVEIPYPQMIRMSATQELNDSLTLLASVAWEDWSEFDGIFISTPVAGNALLREWDDTWHYAMGLRCRGNASWNHYMGVAYDTENGGTCPGGAPWTLTGDYSGNRLIFRAFSYGW